MPETNLWSEVWFEVTSDVLFLDGRAYHRGDLIPQAELGPRSGPMQRIGMIRALATKRLAA